MAELYYKQGHLARAMDVYRRLAQKDPQDSAVRQRLRELRQEWGGSMSFREHVQGVVESVPGALACTVMGFDGIAIDSYEAPGATLDVPTMLTEFSSAATQMRRASSLQPDLGRLGELTIETDVFVTILRPLTDDYFLAVMLKPDSLVGKARYMLRCIAPKVLQELA